MSVAHELVVAHSVVGQVSEQRPVELRICDVHPGDSARSEGVRDSHVRVLAQVDDQWPPILVTRARNEIIDGMHRYEAALLLGKPSITCVFFDGDANDAFIESIRRNVEHGLPLTLGERQAAAIRILELHGDWSDRRIAAMCGLAAGTVGRLRKRSTVQSAHTNSRRGLDGRRRRVDRGVLRQQTEVALTEQPDASLRQIARLVGTSASTVSAVRASLNRTADAPVVKHPGSHRNRAEPSLDNQPIGVASQPTYLWKTDSAVKTMPLAQPFLDWFGRTEILDDWEGYVAAIPLSRVYEVAREAERRSTCWTQFARALERRANAG